MTTTTTEINALGADLAEVNRQLTAAGAASGRPMPPDLLDERDRLLEKLAGLVQVKAVPQTDGTMSVFIGTGQVLVLGSDAAQLAVTAGTADPAQPQVVIRGIGPDVNVTPYLAGGTLGGVLDFNREMLIPARA
jgi:flagellar hook-associated protein 1 FlgK